MKLKLLGCNSLWRELCYLSAQSPHEVDLTLLPCENMRGEALRKGIAAVQDVDYILLGRGFCDDLPLAAATIPLVIPVAHDCAHLLLGNVTRYHRAFSENDDAPRWLAPVGCDRLAPSYGTPCAVVSPLGRARIFPEGTHEYVANLGLLRDLINGIWDDRFFVIAPGMCTHVAGPSHPVRG